MSRVVVTGLGLITALGNYLAANWEALTLIVSFFAVHSGQSIIFEKAGGICRNDM
ncbi:MAG: hypothetical protein ACRDHW_05695 [Ktedonobacteraceae bacterium]